MAETFEIVPFHGDKLLALTENGHHYAAITPICDALGLDAKQQRRRILAHPVLAKGGVSKRTPSAGGMQEHLCLRIDLVPGWLFGIHPNKVKPEARDALIRFQDECFRALADHFAGKPTQRPIPAPPSKPLRIAPPDPANLLTPGELAALSPKQRREAMECARMIPLLEFQMEQGMESERHLNAAGQHINHCLDRIARLRQASRWNRYLHG